MTEEAPSRPAAAASGVVAGVSSPRASRPFGVFVGSEEQVRAQSGCDGET